MRKRLLFFSLLVTWIFSYSQVKDTSKFSFSLQQALDYAVKNQYSLKNASLDESIANAKVGETRGIGLPQVSGSIQYTDNSPLRDMYFSTSSPFASLIPGINPNSNSIIAIPNLFQLPVGADAGATISQLIFNSSYIVGLQAAKTYRELSLKSAVLTKIQVIENVTKAYYMVVINEERLDLFDKNVSRVDSVLTQTRAMFGQGMVEKIDVDRIQVTYNSIISQRENFKNLLDLSLVLLKYQMSMPITADLKLTDRISDFKAEPVTPAGLQMDYSNRIEYSLLQTQRRLNELDLRNNRMAAIPNLSAFANIGEYTQNTKTSDLTTANLWTNYGLFGVTMGVPIFSGFQRSYRVQQSRLNLEKSQNDLSSLELSIDVQIKSAEINLTNSLSTLESQSKNMDLASEVARVTKTKYSEGVGTSLEVNTAESSLLEAQTSYFNAYYDALVAKVDYLKSIGKLGK